MNRAETNSEEVIREQQLKQEIDLIETVTAEFEAAAGDLLNEDRLSPSNARAREEVIALLGVNYVGPEIFNEIFELNDSVDRFKEAIKRLNPFHRVIALPFEEPQLDFVKLKEILNEADEWEIDRKKHETYALVFKPPISFLELRDRANKVAKARGKTPAFEKQPETGRSAFAKKVPPTSSWELIRSETVPGSTSKNSIHNKALIEDKPDLTVSSLPALAALLVGQYLAYGIKLYNGECHYGRTSTSAEFGIPVDLGCFDELGVTVNDEAFAQEDVGLAVSRKLE